MSRRPDGLLQFVVDRWEDFSWPDAPPTRTSRKYSIRSISRCENLSPEALLKFFKKTYFHRNHFSRLMHKHLMLLPSRPCYLITMESSAIAELHVTSIKAITDEYPSLLYVH